MSTSSLLAAIVLIVSSIAVSACSSARINDQEVDRLFRGGDYEAAAQRLRVGVDEQGESGRDALLYQLDLGIALHSAGKYDESISIFLKADRLAEIKDYTSLAAETGALLTSANVLDYKAEEFEYVYISAYLAIAFAAKGDLEGALVEARRVNTKLERLRTEGGRKISQSAFARYFAAVLREAEGDYNAAYLDYKKAWEIRPSFPGIGRDLWRTSSFSGLNEAAEKWASDFGLTRADREEIRKQEGPRSKLGEVVVIFENGLSPEKLPHPVFYNLPKFYPRANPVGSALVEVEGQPPVRSAVLDDVESVAIQNLDEKYAGLVAKRIAGRVAKEVVAAQVEKQTDSPLAGFLTRVVLLASDQADLRSWRLLPKDFQIARVRLPPGLHTVRLTPEGGGQTIERTVQVNAGRKVFVPFRYMP